MMDVINNSVAGRIKPARLDGEHRMELTGSPTRLRQRYGVPSIEYVANEGMELWESDIEGKAVRVAANECGQRVSFNRAGRRQRS